MTEDDNEHIPIMVKERLTVIQLVKKCRNGQKIFFSPVGPNYIQ
jgi:hypothetical protein